MVAVNIAGYCYSRGEQTNTRKSKRRIEKNFRLQRGKTGTAPYASFCAQLGNSETKKVRLQNETGILRFRVVFSASLLEFDFLPVF